MTYLVITYQPLEHTTVYYKKSDFTHLRIFPFGNQTSSTLVSWTTPMRIEGKATNTIYYVSFDNQAEFGFISINEISQHQGISKKRGYIIMSDDCAKSSVGQAGMGGCNQMISVFKSMGVNIVFDNRSITKNGFISLLNQLISQSEDNTIDENDITYFYIIAHGLENSKCESLNAMVMNSTFWSEAVGFNKSAIDYSLLASKLKKINGKIVIFINNCFSGDLLDEFELTNENLEKFSIITAARKSSSRKYPLVSL